MQATIWGAVRLLVDPPANGAWNMALDEALLDTLCKGEGRPTLRFYGWDPPALSLGYAQPSDSVDFAACRVRGVDVVRRPTGGRIVLHVQELTYAVILPAGHESIAQSYCRISKALAQAIAGLGIQADLAPGAAHAAGLADCFAISTAADLVAGGRKLVGSAQVRRHGCFLQHGAIKLAPAAIALADLLPDQAIARPATLADFLDEDPQTLAGELARAIARELGVAWEPAAATEAELAAAAAIAARTSSGLRPPDRRLPPPRAAD